MTEDEANIQLPARYPLGVILAGRTNPAFIVVSSETRSTTIPETVRMYGIADANGLRSVLAENATGRQAPMAAMGSIYEYTLLRPGRAGKLLARAGSQPTEATGLTRRHPARAIDVHWPDRGTGPAHDRIEITQRSGHLHVTHSSTVHGAGQQVDCDESGIAQLLDTVFERCTG